MIEGQCKKISVIIPVYNEQDNINLLIDHLKSISKWNDIEIIVVDGSVDSGTINKLSSDEIVTLTSSKGRAVQMNRGAEASKGEVLLFLHADTFLPENAFECILLTMANGNYDAGAFSLSIKSNSFSLKIISFLTTLRSRITKTPYGDQAIFISKKAFNKIGGYSDMIFLEDVDLIGKLRKNGGNIKIVSDKVSTSARKWRRKNILYRSFKNRCIMLMYMLGVNPLKLKKYY